VACSLARALSGMSTDPAADRRFLRHVRLADEAPRDGYPFVLPAVRQLPSLRFGMVTCLVGDNGTGKSTSHAGAGRADRRVPRLRGPPGVRPRPGAAGRSAGRRELGREPAYGGAMAGEPTAPDPMVRRDDLRQVTYRDSGKLLDRAAHSSVAGRDREAVPRRAVPIRAHAHRRARWDAQAHAS